MASESSAAASELRRSITEASQRVGEIIDDAERAAAEIRAEAQEEARIEAQRAVNESAAELASVVSPLVERVEGLRVEAASLMDELQVVTERLRKLTQPNESGLPASEPEALESVSEPAIEAEPDGPAATSLDAQAPESAGSSAPPGPVPVPYPGKAAASDPELSGPPEEALLRATQMAVAGNSRPEIEETLRDEFGLDDPVPVVDDILGTA